MVGAEYGKTQALGEHATAAVRECLRQVGQSNSNISCRLRGFLWRGGGRGVGGPARDTPVSGGLSVER